MTVEPSLLFPIPEHYDDSGITSKKGRKTDDRNTTSRTNQNEEVFSNELDVEENSLKNLLPKGTDSESILSKQRGVRKINSLCDEAELKINSILESLTLNLRDYDVQVDISKKPLIKKAVRKIFKKPYNYINKEMYLEAIKRMQELQEDEINKVVEDE